MEKTIVMWKFVKPEYTKAACIIGDYNTFGNNCGLNKDGKSYFGAFIAGTKAEEDFKNAGVLELWFEPVYE